MKSPLLKALLIVLAMLATAACLLGIMTIVNGLTIYNKTPADFLPKEHVRLALHQPTSEMMEAFSSRFPILNEVPLEKDIIVAAMLKHHETEVGVAFYKDHPDGMPFGSFNVIVTDAAAFDLLGSENSLQKESTYKELLKQYSPEDSWAYVHRPQDSSASTFIERVLQASVFGAHASAGITLTTDGIGIRTLNATTLPSQRSATPTLPSSVLTISASHGKHFWHGLLSTLAKEDTYIAEGMMEEVASRLGRNVRFRSTLLPLLSKPSSVVFTVSGSYIGYVLTGSHEDAVTMQQQIDRIYTNYKDELETSKITKRVLDKRFTSIDIRHDQTMILEDEYSYEDWNIKAVRHKERRSGMSTATQNDRYMISNTLQNIEEAISSLKTIEDPTALFTIDLGNSTALLTDVYPQSMRPTSFGTGTLSISSGESRGGSFILLSLPGKSKQLLDSLL